MRVWRRPWDALLDRLDQSRWGWETNEAQSNAEIKMHRAAGIESSALRLAYQHSDSDPYMHLRC